MNLGNAFREGMRGEAKRDIQNEFILQQVIKNQDIEASKEEIEEELGNIAEKQGRSIAFIKSRYGKEERESLGRQLQRDKAQAYLLEQVTRNEETLTRSARVERLHEERAQEEAAAAAEHEHSHSHDHDHDHNCGHDHSHDHDHDHK
jgi:FKBP-type peptidyl-prolyl cis-trans isomerase (trigger factor)